MQKILGEENIDANGTIKTDILQATQMCNSAWDQVEPSTMPISSEKRASFTRKKCLLMVLKE